MSEWSIGAVMITRNRPEMAGETMRGMLETRGYPLARLVVVDSSDADDDEAGALAGGLSIVSSSDHAGVPIDRIWTPPTGPGQAKNDGAWLLLQRAPLYDAIYFTDDDMEYREGWLARLVEALEADPQLGAVGAAWAHHQSHHFIASRLLDGPGGPGLRRLVYRSNQPGMSLLVRWACWRECGPFPAKFVRFGYDDTAFVQRARDCGWSIGHIEPEMARHLTRAHWEDDPSMAGGGEA